MHRKRSRLLRRGWRGENGEAEGEEDEGLDGEE